MSAEETGSRLEGCRFVPGLEQENAELRDHIRKLEAAVRRILHLIVVHDHDSAAAEEALSALLRNTPGTRVETPASEVETAAADQPLSA